MRLLIVDDETKIADSLKQGFEQEGYAVDVSYDGIEGLDFASSNIYDLIILDIMLPGVDGIEICNKLRNNRILTPIIMLTARGEIDDKVNGLNVGADDYLSKPFSFNELLARVKALLRRPSSLINNELSCGDLQINLDTYEVHRGKKKVQLTKKEFSLLEYLIRNQGQILTKEKIIEHVWNFDSDILLNTVEVYIGYLRNKIDKPFKSNYLKTVRGFGYLLQNKKD